MCNRTHLHGSVKYIAGDIYLVSEYFFSSYFYYEISTVGNRYLGSMSSNFFNDDFVSVNRCIFEVEELFNNIMDGDVFFI
jgi:hypothetical protein